MNIRPRKKGYTMVELMVVVALLSILVVSVIGMFLTLLKTGGATQALARVKEEGDYATITLERIIRGGKGYDLTNCGAELTFYIPPPTTGPDITNRIYLNSGKIVLDDDGDSGTPDKELTSSRVTVSNLQFNCTPKAETYGAIVTLTFLMTDANSLNQPEVFKSTVIMRNY